jgi:rRNA maturation endonuclease Nob1
MGMKLKSKYNMQLPDGEHLIEGKIYVVKDGQVVEIKEEEKVEETMEQKEEVAMADTVVEEEEVKEEVEAAVDPTMDAEAILAIVQPMIAEQINSVLAIVAELKSQLEEALGAETEVEEETIEIDAKTMLAENLRKFNQFNSK